MRMSANIRAFVTTVGRASTSATTTFSDASVPRAGLGVIALTLLLRGQSLWAARILS